ncbi:HNH endonuclease [Saccharothrix sp. HUAS TT1]|uniref:HNH endonuclease n=1 Tax=unclassified Saccharothrix TaxID=2593673 RepID=UPI00345B62FF
MPDTAPDRATRLRLAILRDGNDCTWCRRPFTGHVTPTTDHLVPKVKGGPSWSENEVAACHRCNRARGHLSPVDWLTECEHRGWHPDRARVVRLLTSLAEAITARGGQRRARPYLHAQLRRLTDTADGTSAPT